MYKPNRDFSNLVMAGRLVQFVADIGTLRYRLAVHDPPIDEFIARPLDLINSDPCSNLGINGKHPTRYDSYSSHIKHGTLKSRHPLGIQSVWIYMN
jgi:hypothetical protein